MPLGGGSSSKFARLSSEDALRLGGVASSPVMSVTRNLPIGVCSRSGVKNFEGEKNSAFFGDAGRERPGKAGEFLGERNSAGKGFDL